MSTAESWPALPLAEWRPTKETIHRYCQIVGKVRMALMPHMNHWWNVTLRVSARGITTGPMPCAVGLAEIEMDLVAHRVVVSTSAGTTHEFALYDGLSVAAFHTALFDALRAAGIHCVILGTPFDLGDSPPFAEDEEHHAYDADAVARWWAVIRSSHVVFTEFAGAFTGKTSPVQLFWHSFDLAVTRFSGRRAPAIEGADPVTAEAYSHEVVSFGFWAGDDRIPDPAYYSYTAPAPPGLTETALRPDGARWQTGPTGSLALYMYDDARAAADPVAAVREFLDSAFEAGSTLAGWDVP
ncbi:MAG: DUF5996 family protein [Thermoleophilia bacterium]